MHEIVVVDTSVLIALQKINALSILCKLYKQIIIPEAVMKEFGDSSMVLNRSIIQKVQNRLANLLRLNLNLGIGEADVIAFAYETSNKVLIDDLKARKIAEDLGLSVSGTIGVLLKAEQFGFIESSLQKIYELKENGFYVANEILEDIKRLKLKS